MKFELVLSILVLYIAFLVNGEEEERTENISNEDKTQQEDEVESVDNNSNENNAHSIDDNSEEKQDTESINDNTLKETQNVESEKETGDNVKDSEKGVDSEEDDSEDNASGKEDYSEEENSGKEDGFEEETQKDDDTKDDDSLKDDVSAKGDDYSKEDKKERNPKEETNKKDVDSEKDDSLIYVDGIDDETEDLLKRVVINKVLVVKDNVSGHKHSSFSEDKSENRGDEITVAQVQKEAEKRILQKEKEMLQNGETEDKQEEIDADSDVPPIKPEVIYTDDNGNLVQSDGDKEDETAEENLVKDDNHGDETNTVVPPANDASADENDKETVDENGGSTNEKVESDDMGIPQSFDDEFGSLSKEEISSTTKESKADVDNNKESPADRILKSHADGLAGDKVQKDKSFKKNPKETKSLPGAKLHEEAMELLKVSKKDTKKAYKLLAEATDLNNTDAAEKIAYPYLFGDDIKRNKTKAVELFHSLAEKGIPLGQQGLGFIYGAGLNVNSSQAKALIYTTFAALGGNAMAQMMLGYRYFNGIGVAKSCESALTHYKKVAKKVTDETTSHGGNAVQRIRLYDELEQPGGTSGQIDEDLLQYYQFLADKGDLQAQVGLGQLYFQGGRGIDVNYEKAFKYFQLAGDVDNGNGLAYLGKMYLDGLHVDKDQKKAFEYFTKAAGQSNPIGQAGLGMIYLKGAGVKKNYDQAMKYFSQAAEQGWMEGQLQLGNMYYNGIGVKKDYRQAVKYFTFASQSGHVMAFYNLASMHATGAGVMRSCNTATELFKNVAERGKWSMMFMDAYDSYRAGDLETALLKYCYLAELGYEVAQSNVAYVLEKGELTWFSQNQTYARSLLQWSRAAHQGYAVARVKVGDYHFYGYGTKVDYDTAALHYRMASDQQNNPQAMFNLGYMHEQGFGLKEDIHLAKRFYDMAAEASPDAHFPVTLALLKLTLYFTWEWIQKNYRFWEYAPLERWWLYILQKLGPDWDMYLITALAVLLGGLLLFRRTLRR